MHSLHPRWEPKVAVAFRSIARHERHGVSPSGSPQEAARRQYLRCHREGSHFCFRSGLYLEKSVRTVKVPITKNPM